jgi:oligopeptide/dipeptide ABC transporter ATP-binding protein
MPEPLFRIEKLKKHFPVTKGILLGRTKAHVRAVDGIDFAIQPGETFSLVGESGCGKTTTSMLLLRLLDPDSGAIWFNGDNIAGFRGNKLKGYREAVQAVFQDPYSSLNPRMKVADIVAEPLVANEYGAKNDVRDRVVESLHQVGLEQAVLDLYPHEFSGGQRQRIALARALALKPKLVVLDEPVSALDVSIRAQIMNLMKDLQQQMGVAYLLIAHGLGTVRYMSHWVGVMYLGKIVECAPSEELFTHPMHPYTQALFSAALPSHPSIHRKEIVLTGEVPSPMKVPIGCRFHPRCFRERRLICTEEEPQLIEMASRHLVCCHRES